MPRNITVTFEDGSTHVYQNAPDIVTPEQVSARAAQEFGKGVSSLDGGRKPSAVKQFAADAIGGAIRGAGSIGATLLYPIDKATDIIKGDRGPNVTGLVTGQQPKSRNEERRAAMDAGLQELLGSDPTSLTYQGGKLAGEIAGTAGAGGGVANAISRFAPSAASAAPNVLSAIASSGMIGGNLATRAAGGAVTGGVSAGIVNPDDVLTGAAVGAILPGVLKAAGMAGRSVAELFASADTKTARKLAAALNAGDAQQAQAIATQLRSARELVPGSAPTVAQVLRTPQAGILERVISDTPGGVQLKERYAQQAAARLGALDRVAPVVPTGAKQAKQDFGQAVGNWATGARGAARARTGQLYDAVPQDDAMLYIPELAPIRDKYFGPGVFGQRGAVDEAVNVAGKIGTEAVGGIVPTRATVEQPRSLAQAIRQLGGLSIKDNDGLRGELAGLGGDFKNLIRTNGGVSPGQAAEAMREAGYIPNEDARTLFDALRAEAIGKNSYSTSGLPERAWRAAQEAAMGDAPQAAAIPKKVTLRDFEDLRKSIGGAQRAAAMSPERAAEAKALGDMKMALDDRINQVVRGDGAIDEDLPIAWADALTAARKSKADEVAQFGTGPQAKIFRRGADGQPMAQGGEVASLFWGNRPGLSDDVKSLRRLVNDNPALMSQFKSMVTTEGASTANASGNIGAKFVRWVENQLPGLKAGFDPSEVKALQRIAQDIQRSEAAAAAGMSRGSNTYQNAANALSLGVLDNPLLNAAASRVPVVSGFTGPALQWFKGAKRDSMATELARLLSDPKLAAEALSGNAFNALAGSGRVANAFEALGYRAAPVLAADR